MGFKDNALKTTWKSHTLLKNAAPCLLARENMSRITSVLQQHHWLPVIFHAQFEVLVITYKAILQAGRGIPEGHGIFHPELAQPLRSADVGLCSKSRERTGAQIPPFRRQAKTKGL